MTKKVQIVGSINGSLFTTSGAQNPDQRGNLKWSRLEAQCEPLSRALRSHGTGMSEFLADEIAGLPRRERLVFSLYYYEELETSEIAFVLGETGFTVLHLHAAAVGHLKTRLEDAAE